VGKAIADLNALSITVTYRHLLGGLASCRLAKSLVVWSLLYFARNKVFHLLGRSDQPQSWGSAYIVGRSAGSAYWLWRFFEVERNGWI